MLTDDERAQDDDARDVRAAVATLLQDLSRPITSREVEALVKLRRDLGITS